MGALETQSKKMLWIKYVMKVLLRSYAYSHMSSCVPMLVFSYFLHVRSYAYLDIFLACAHTRILIFSSRGLILVSWYFLHVRSYSYSYIFLILVSWRCLHVCLPGAEGVALACDGLAEAIAVEAPASSGRLRTRVFMCHTSALNANY